MERVSIITEGGGTAGAWVIGVVDGLYRHYGLKRVDYAVGSSSGILPLLYLASEQMEGGANKVPTFCSSKKFIDKLNILHNKSILDIDYLVDEILTNQIPLDINKLRKSKMKIIIPVTEEKTNRVEYFTNHSKQDMSKILKAAMAEPFACARTIKIGKKKYYDGGYSTPVVIDHPTIKNTKK